MLCLAQLREAFSATLTLFTLSHRPFEGPRFADQPRVCIGADVELGVRGDGVSLTPLRLMFPDLLFQPIVFGLCLCDLLFEFGDPFPLIDETLQRDFVFGDVLMSAERGGLF